MSQELVEINGVRVIDASMESTTEFLYSKLLQGSPYSAVALHVGGLRPTRRDRTVRHAYNASDLCYADGAAVVLAAKRRGAKSISRTPTTDLLPAILELASAKGIQTRVALIGGPQGLASEAGLELEKKFACQTVFSTHGFHKDWSGELEGLRVANPDLVLVGLGNPIEMQWIAEHRNELPNALVLTCGGLFGFITGRETRAPDWMQKSGLEWLYRVKQAPTRLAGRYFVGAFETLRALIHSR